MVITMVNFREECYQWIGISYKYFFKLTAGKRTYIFNYNQTNHELDKRTGTSRALGDC